MPLTASVGMKYQRFMGFSSKGHTGSAIDTLRALRAYQLAKRFSLKAANPVKGCPVPKRIEGAGTGAGSWGRRVRRRIQCLVNGVSAQDSRTSRLIFAPQPIVSFIGNVMTPLPGEVTLTGTPSGGGPLRAGDHVEVRIACRRCRARVRLSLPWHCTWRDSLVAHQASCRITGVEVGA